MEVKCSVQFSGGSGKAAHEVKTFFKEQGWREAEGAFSYTLEAELGGVDGPSVAMHEKIRALYLPEGPIENTVPVTVLISAGGRGMFNEPAAFGFAGGKWGIRISETDPPQFDDLLRLRDKTIATLAAISKER